MRSIGIVRRVDDLGRLVLPKEMHETLNLSAGNSLEIFTQDDEIILRKRETSCIFCGSQENLKKFREKKVCEKCANQI